MMHDSPLEGGCTREAVRYRMTSALPDLPHRVVEQLRRSRRLFALRAEAARHSCYFRGMNTILKLAAIYPPSGRSA